MKQFGRDAQATRERILEAAMAEFAAHGLAGARVDRIALAAEANKNSLYRYFESKEGLFATVLQRTLERFYTEVPFTPDDLPGFAARLFDFAMANPDVMRLLAWYGLERHPDVVLPGEASLGQKQLVLADLQERQLLTREFSPAFLMTVVSSLVSAWTVVNPFLTMIDPDGDVQEAELRQSIQRAVSRLFAP